MNGSQQCLMVATLYNGHARFVVQLGVLQVPLTLCAKII